MTSAKSPTPTDHPDTLSDSDETPSPAPRASTPSKPELPISAEEAEEAEGDGEAANEEAPEDLDALRSQIAELRDEFLRARADADNARKRAQSEVSNARRFALESFAGELLNVRDSLDLARGVDLAGNDDVIGRVVEGLELTLKQLDAAFERFSVFEVSPGVGDKLDPESHQAMSLIESTDVAPNHICQVIQKGYRLHDRLLRPAMVIVAKAPADS